MVTSPKSVRTQDMGYVRNFCTIVDNVWITLAKKSVKNWDEKHRKIRYDSGFLQLHLQILENIAQLIVIVTEVADFLHGV